MLRTPFMLRTLTFLAFLTTQMLCSGCNDSVKDPATGNIDRLADAVFIQPDPTLVPRQSFVVVTNPDLEQIRIFDAYEHRFIRAPNVYFPLSIPVGVSTRKLAAAPKNHKFVFALDGAEDKIYVIRTTAEGGAAFTLVTDIDIRTRRAPADIAASTTATGFRLFLSYPDDGEIQVLAWQNGATQATTEAILPLFTGARPNLLEVDPSEDVLIVGDATSEKLTLIRLEDLETDRVLDVGGAVQHIATGMVNPGDGLAPMALLTLRNRSQVAALRLFRPTHREERYALVGRVELPSPGAIGYIPRQKGSELTDTTVCCPRLPIANEATTAWGAVISSTGQLYYLRFDGSSQNRNLTNARNDFRLIDLDPTAPELLFSSWSLADGTPADELAPTLLMADAATATTEVKTYLGPGDMTFTWQAALKGARNDKASLQADTQFIQFEQKIVGARVGDALVFDLADRNIADDLCALFAETRLEKNILSVEDNKTMNIGALSTAEKACLESASFTASIHAKNAFIVESSTRGNLGRMRLQGQAGVDPDFIEVDGLLFAIADDAPETQLSRGAVMALSIAQNIAPLELRLGDPTTSNADSGFGLASLYPRAMVGGEVSIPGVDNEPVIHTRRIYLVTGTGSLLSFNETETNLDYVLDLQ